MKKLLALLIACSMLFLAEGCGKQKAAPSAGVSVPGSEQQLRGRQKRLKQLEAEGKSAPAGKTSDAAKQ